MAYIGRQPGGGLIFGSSGAGTIAGTINGSNRDFTLPASVDNAQQVLLFVDGLQQSTDKFTITSAPSATLNFNSGNAPPTGSEVACVIIQDSFSLATVNDDTITAAKLNAALISGHTNIGEAPAETDELLISDAGVLKAITVDKLLDPAGYTNIGATPAGSDELLLSDAGVLKAVTVTNLMAAAGGGGLFASYAILTEEIAANTHSGTFTSGAWRTRHLDDEITDPDSIVAISSDQFTPISGTYLAQWSAPAYQVQDHQTRLYNVTATALVEMGTAEFATPTPATTNRSFGMARFTANGSDAYEIQHQCQTTVGSSGFGERTNFGIYHTTQLILFKEA